MKDENKEPEFDAANPKTHHQSQLMEWIMSNEAATVQSLIDGDPDKPEFVRHYTQTITYDVFSLKGIEAKIDVESYAKLAERMENMESAELEDGKKKYTKKDVLKFIRATCYNKCKATRDELATRDDFVKMAEFVEDILFNQKYKDPKDILPEGISHTQMVSKYYLWESHKFIVKVGVDSYVQLESVVRKIKKKAQKEAAQGIIAETKKVVFLQKSMKLKPGEYCSGAEYAAYYKELFKAMYPTEFGFEKGLEKGTNGIKPKDEEQTTISDCLKCGNDPCTCIEEIMQEEPQPEKKKRGRPKGSKGKGKSK